MTAQPALLSEYLGRSARLFPHKTAVRDPAHGEMSYRDLEHVSDRVRDALRSLGVGPGHRVGMCIRKSIDAVALIFGILKAGAAYVPADPFAPIVRSAAAFEDCGVSVVFMEGPATRPLGEHLRNLSQAPALICLDPIGGAAQRLRNALDTIPSLSGKPAYANSMDSSALAYILYTSGSTGRPKGVMLSHMNATSFVDWCSETILPHESDRFSSHAPFHFDLSILDLFVAIKHGATIVLIDDALGKDPAGLSRTISEERISVWYSTPSVLSLIAQFGRIPDHDYSTLRLVLFAGEVFPVKHLRSLSRLWPGQRYLNLYGPTETNVCTFYEVPLPIPDERSASFPIGRACSHLRTIVVDEQGDIVAPGQEGTLCVSGPAVMQGYWNRPEQTKRAFLDKSGLRWYVTGDLVIEEPDGNYTYTGRRDRMVKKRGYRIELGEIESVLYRHPDVRETGVIAIPHEDSGICIKAFVSCAGSRRPSIIELKRFCSENLPLYMVPDLFCFQPLLPRTSTAKVDYERLKETT